MYRLFFKRLIDIIGSAICIVILTPVWIIVPILIKRDDGGSVFYRAERIGKGTKMFRMWKYRSMKEHAEDIRNADGSTFNSEDDPRVTKIGRTLRKTSLDELPQLFNVFLGDMSMIGPRPSEWSQLDTYLPEEMDKMKARPGITGYTAAYYRNSIPMREKRKYDAWYANNISFLLDTKIVFKTIETVVFRKNLYTNAESDSDSGEEISQKEAVKK